MACEGFDVINDNSDRLRLMMRRTRGPARKATGFTTNDEYIAEAVERRSFVGHGHIQLLSVRAKACEKYLPRLVAVTFRALRRSMRAARCGESQRMMGRDHQLTIAAVEAGPTLEKSRSCCRSLTAQAVPKGSRTGAQGCRWTLPW